MKNSLTMENNLNNNLELENKQQRFIESTLGKTINVGIDLGIRTILPDYLEDQIIDLKDNLLEYGLKEGIKKSIDDSIKLGKSVIGIATGKFNDVNQVQAVIKNGGLIDNISSLLNDITDIIYKKNIISYNVANTIKQGKNIILNNIEKSIENKFQDQVNSINYIQKYINNWKNFYNNKDIDGMEREFKKIENKINDLIPMENVIKDVRKIENLHSLIKKKGNDFNLSQQEIELAEKI